MLQLVSVSKQYGPRSLFEGLSWHVPEGERVALIGPNGAGKTTLFRIVSGRESPEAGEVVLKRGARLGYLQQEPEDLGGLTPLEAVLEAGGEAKALEEELAVLLEKMAGTPEPEVLARYDFVENRFRQLGGYQREAEARRILDGLGFTQGAMERPVSELSGGWRMRVSLARLLFAKPELLLLDEPTNHLDLETLLWFEDFLVGYPGTVVVISHDRAFLDRFASSIAELGPRGITVYKGNFTRYMEQKSEQLEQLRKAAKQQERSFAQAERFIERFRYKATKAKAVQSRIKALEKVERIEVHEEADQAPRFRFPKPPRSGREVLRLEGVHKAYGDKVLYHGLDLSLWRGQRLALVGPNGAGKSTLLKMMAGVLAPDTGEVVLGHQVERAYYAQHQLEILDAEKTVLGEMESAASYDQLPQCRSVLGAFGFSGEEVDKKVSVLSGGEKARLSLAKMLFNPANLFLMDEPTNHLDMASCDVLEQALEDYDGTLVIISHDRHFINEVANVIVAIEDGKVAFYPGNWEDYERKRAELEAEKARAQEEAAARVDAPARGSDRQRRRQEAELRQAFSQKTRGLQKTIKEAEAAIGELEEALEALDAKLIEPEFLKQGEAVSAAYAEREQLVRSHAEEMARWEEAAFALEEEREALEAEMAALR